jgi:hypothetical protein
MLFSRPHHVPTMGEFHLIVKRKGVIRCSDFVTDFILEFILELTSRSNTYTMPTVVLGVIL